MDLWKITKIKWLQILDFPKFQVICSLYDTHKKKITSLLHFTSQIIYIRIAIAVLKREKDNTRADIFIIYLSMLWAFVLNSYCVSTVILIYVFFF